MLRPVVVAALLLPGLVSACSDDRCHGQAYHPDLGAAGSRTPIQALEVWLGSHQGFEQPPDEGWIVQDTGAQHAERVTLTNDDGQGWWVAAERTEDGGYVVSEATDHASGCEDQLS